MSPFIFLQSMGHRGPLPGSSGDWRQVLPPQGAVVQENLTHCGNTGKPSYSTQSLLSFLKVSAGNNPWCLELLACKP